MVSQGVSTKFVNFMTPGAGVLVLGHDRISHLLNQIVEYMTPGYVVVLGCVHTGDIVKILNFKNLLLFSLGYDRHTE